MKILFTNDDLFSDMSDEEDFENSPTMVSDTKPIKERLKKNDDGSSESSKTKINDKSAKKERKSTKKSAEQSSDKAVWSQKMIKDLVNIVLESPEFEKKLLMEVTSTVINS